MSRQLEDFLPPQMQFEVTLCELRDMLEEQIEFVIDEYGDCIDPHVEFDRDAVKLWGLSSALYTTLAHEDEPRDKVLPVLYRSAAFALQIVHELQSAPIDHLPIGEYVAHGENLPEDMKDKLASDGSNYMARREQLDTMIGMYAYDIDPSGLYHHHVDSVMTLMFMLCERAQANKYYQQAAEQLRYEDFEL